VTEPNEKGPRKGTSGHHEKLTDRGVNRRSAEPVTAAYAGAADAAADRQLRAACHIAGGPVLRDAATDTRSEEADCGNAPDIPLR
jgi:hypothetical protein